MTCFGWKEWNIGPLQSGLKYEYRIRQAGVKRALLFYFGRSARSSPVVFPVGSFDREFGNEVVVRILDSVGDFWQKIINVTVSQSKCVCVQFRVLY